MRRMYKEMGSLFRRYQASIPADKDDTYVTRIIDMHGRAYIIHANRITYFGVYKYAMMTSLGKAFFLNVRTGV